MFINGGIGASWSEPENIALFYQGYGQAAVNQSALAHYRYERIVQDIASYSQQLLLTDAGGADRESGLGKLANQFTPNGVIAHAYRTENILPPNQLTTL